jgi:hypothetical protein
MDNKLVEYSKPEKWAHLKTRGLTELDLLVHGGFKGFALNTPSGHLTFEAITQRGADYYAAHPRRHIFDRVWF